MLRVHESLQSVCDGGTNGVVDILACFVRGFVFCVGVVGDDSRIGIGTGEYTGRWLL